LPRKFASAVVCVTVILLVGYYFIFTHHSINDSVSPEIFKPRPIPATVENFQKEIVLQDLDTPQKGYFLPPSNISLNDLIHHSRYDDRRNAYDYPWAMDFLPGKDLLITTRLGHLLRYIPAQKRVAAITGLPTDIATDGYQGGLLDIAVDPDFYKNNVIFFSHVMARENQQGAREYVPCVVRATLQSLQINIIKRYCIKAWGLSPTQLGGGLALDDTGHLFFSVGDRTQRELSQELLNSWGKILRLDKNTLTHPKDNPFKNHENKVTSIWSIGHRNVQGMFYDRVEKSLYAVEHGPRGGDELNIIFPGVNYGWPVASYGREYEKDVMVGQSPVKIGIAQPLYYYTPSISPSAVLRYRGKMFPEWQGHFFITALSGMQVNQLVVSRGKIVREDRLLSYMQMRYRDIKEGPDGDIYLLSEDGYLLRLYR